MSFGTYDTGLMCFCGHREGRHWGAGGRCVDLPVSTVRRTSGARDVLLGLGEGAGAMRRDDPAGGCERCSKELPADEVMCCYECGRDGLCAACWSNHGCERPAGSPDKEPR